jgi:putative hydrolase of the HAD superfamily
MRDERADADVRALIVDYDGVCTPSIRELVADPTLLADGSVPIRPDAHTCIGAALDQGLVVVVLSNDLPTSTVDTTPILQRVDHVLSLANAPIRKPDRRAFQRALLLAGVSPDRALVVDDSASNVAGARAAGIPAIHFDVTAPAESWAAVRRLLGLTTDD